jgi:hypothetical protein
MYFYLEFYCETKWEASGCPYKKKGKDNTRSTQNIDPKFYMGCDCRGDW